MKSICKISSKRNNNAFFNNESASKMDNDYIEENIEKSEDVKNNNYWKLSQKLWLALMAFLSFVIMIFEEYISNNTNNLLLGKLSSWFFHSSLFALMIEKANSDYYDASRKTEEEIEKGISEKSRYLAMEVNSLKNDLYLNQGKLKDKDSEIARLKTILNS